jgi:hypothetical protein
VNLSKPEREAIRKTAPISSPPVESIKKLKSGLSTSLHNAKPDTSSLTNPREEELVEKAILEMEYMKAKAITMACHRPIL